MRTRPSPSVCAFLLSAVYYLAADTALSDSEYPLDFGLQEARNISTVQGLVRSYHRSSDDAKKASLDKLARLYRGKQDTFLSIVVLDGLLELGELGSIGGDESRDSLLAFARKMKDGSVEKVLSYLETREPRVREFLLSWFLFRGADQGLRKRMEPRNRQAKILALYQEIREQMTKLPSGKRADLLFDRLTNWKVPMEYEACMLLVVEEYKSSPTHTGNRLVKLLKANVPRTEPPPYGRDHTMLHILCVLAKAINDEGLRAEVKSLMASNSKYVAKKVSGALPWIQQEVQYPLKYFELRRLYEPGLQY